MIIRGYSVEQFHNGENLSKAAGQALRQMKDLRARIDKSHPHLLGYMRQKLWGLPEIDRNGNELINREKNRQTVQKFMEIKAPSAEFRNKLKHMLAEAEV